MGLSTRNELTGRNGRLRAKTQEQHLMNLAVQGAGLSAWEAQVLVDCVKEVYFSEPGVHPLRSGQLRYECVAATEGAGKPLAACQLVTVTLTLLDPEDRGPHGAFGPAALRQRQVLRLTEEARDQGGLLSQEDLAQLLSCREAAMKSHPSTRAALYGPVQAKSFPSALSAFFAAECPMLAGERARRVLVESITELVEQCYPATAHLRPGQVPWVTVRKDETASHGKRIAQTHVVTVLLDLVAPEDAARLARGSTLAQLRRDLIARLFLQADAQGGCLTHTEIALLLKIHPATASLYTRQWEAEHGRTLPRRGTVHDLGRTLTHKAETVRKLFLEGKSVEQVCRETRHSPLSVHRYIAAFKQVLLCHRKGLCDEEIAYATHRSPGLVREYQSLIAQLSQRNATLERLLNQKD